MQIFFDAQPWIRDPFPANEFYGSAKIAFLSTDPTEPSATIAVYDYNNFNNSLQILKFWDEVNGLYKVKFHGDNGTIHNVTITADATHLRIVNTLGNIYGDYSIDGGLTWINISSMDSSMFSNELLFQLDTFVEIGDYIEYDDIVILAGDSLDTAQFADTNTVYLFLTPSADESQSGATSDAATGLVKFSPTASDVAEFIDAAAYRLAFDILSSEERFSDDVNTAFVELEPSSDDIAILVDAATERLLLKPSGTDEYISNIQDEATVYLYLTPSGYDYVRVVELIAWVVGSKWSQSLAFRKYWAKRLERVFSGGVSYRRWWSSAN